MDAPSAFFRKQPDLLASIRPVRTYPGVLHPATRDFDLVVQDRASPFSLILSVARLLDWHGDRRGQPAYARAARAIEAAVAEAVMAGEATVSSSARQPLNELPA